jgi:hypothetical protein
MTADGTDEAALAAGASLESAIALKHPVHDSSRRD